ncbi:cytosine permease [Cerasibacillus quisquiliarum]|uniref:Cytosine permease n=1 Tax=Cerasibacillus quisquiliarum TaxID=227865 RepID=A0A511UVN9_9BACI|nr:cytosine permease [Cerasibacillus quisquiliarum]MBB5145129.1 cytosine permease [Cerasibacillus quisquiliarum]GEN29981.1 cytosine permease [Cerasibacillus quisquiliarum]
MDNEKNKLIDDYELEPVPDDKRKGWVKLTLVWIAGIIALSATALGGALGSGMSLNEAIVSTLIGTFLLSLISVICCIVGAKTGLSTSLVSSFALGRYGSMAVSVIIAISLFGWFGVQLDLFGSSLNKVILDVFNVNISPSLLMIIGGILMTITATIGYNAIEKLSVLAVPLLAILLIGSVYVVSSSFTYAELNTAPLTSTPLTIGMGISVVIGSLAVGAIIGPDISRYAKSVKDAVISSMLGYFVGYSIVLIISAILAKATSEVDVVAIMIGIGWGTGGMLVLILAQWTTNNTNLYSSALGFSVVFRRVSKYVLTIIAGLIGTAFAIAGIYTQFIPFLNVLSILIPPIGGVYTADFIFRHKQYSFNNIDKIPKIRLSSLLTWTLASIVAFMTTPAPTGFGLFTLTGASGVDAFLFAFTLQFIRGLIGQRRTAEKGEIIV